MGVERFFSSLKRNYNFITDLNNKKITCEHLFIDFNSIVHISSQFLLDKVKTDNTMTSDIFETMLIKKVGHYIIDMLTNTFTPQSLVSIIICVDGVPSMSKIFEQKKRRYMGDLLSQLNDQPTSLFSWSRNNISPGTDFMRKMMTYLKSTKFENMILHICYNLKHYSISGIDIMGEGEIKILHHIIAMQKTKHKQDKYVVYSPDSDIIIILLMTNVNVTMLRYDQQKSTEDNYIYSTIDINMYKNILYDYIVSKINKPLDKERVVSDLVFLMTVFGDDFLPKLETVRVNTDIHIILDHYIQIVIRHGYLLKKTILWEIDADHFYQYLTLLGKKEEHFLKRNARYHMSSNYHKQVESVVGVDLYMLHKNMPKNNDVNVKKKMHQIITSHYIELLQYIDGKTLMQHGIYNNETDYVMSNPHTLLGDMITYYNQTKNLPTTIPITKHHPQILLVSYNSNDTHHRNKLQHMHEIEKKLYRIENKLDGYYKILNPIDNFYKNIYNNNIHTTLYYKEHFPHIKKFTIVKDYLVGLNWVMNYYLNTDPTYRNVDLSWYYPHNRSPLLQDIVIAYDKQLITHKPSNPFHNNYMTPIEHFIYVSPFHSNITDTIKKYLGSLSQKQINNILMFIKINKKYYYNLDDIHKNIIHKKLIDCSGSIFISKCHLLFMENYIDMIQFLQDIKPFLI